MTKRFLMILVLGSIFCTASFAEFLICETKVNEFSDGSKKYTDLETYKIYRRQSDDKWCARNPKFTEKCNEWLESDDEIKIWLVSQYDNDPNVKWEKFIINRFTGKFVNTVVFKKTRVNMYQKGTCSLQEKKF